MNRNRKMNEYLREHLSLYVFVSVLFLMGVVFGTMLVNALTLEQNQELGRYMGSFLHTVQQGLDGGGGAYFLQALGTHLKWVVLIGLLGFTVIGIPIVLILAFLKGVFIGFTIGFIVGDMGWDGMLFALVSVAPQNVVLVPVVIIASVSALSFSLQLVKQRFHRPPSKLSPAIAGYAMTMAVLVGAIVVVSLMEAYLVPALVNWTVPHILSFA